MRPMRPMRLLVSAMLVVGPASALAAAPAPAGAATCSSSGGVSVVVDYRELGGGTVTACAADGGGKSGAAIFAEVGVALSYAARQPGFVCRVNGVPMADPCVNASPTNAYWGLWWSDGTKPWGYSSAGVGGMTVPAGGSVGWAWQQDRAGQGVPPGIPAPTAEASTPSPSPSPSSSASPSPSGTSSPTPTPTPTSPGGDQPTTGPGSGSTSGSKASGSKPTRPGGTADGEASPSPSAESSPTRSTDSDTAGPPPVESRADSRPKARSTQSPRDSRDGARPDEIASSDDTSAAAGTTGTAAEADPPTRIPAALTWGIAALLGVAIVVSAVLSRRRRQG